MPWTVDLKSGVKQDHRGRLFRVAHNSRGKQDIVYIEPDANAPLARMIPVTPEPVYKLKERPIVTTGVDSKRPVLHKPVRLNCMKFRFVGNPEIHTLERHTSIEMDLKVVQAQAYQPTCDWHVAYHMNEGDVATLVKGKVDIKVQA